MAARTPWTTLSNGRKVHVDSRGQFNACGSTPRSQPQASIVSFKWLGLCAACKRLLPTARSPHTWTT